MQLMSVETAQLFTSYVQSVLLLRHVGGSVKSL